MATTRRVYLDHNASAPLLAEAREAMGAVLDLTGNPSSVHAEGRRLRGIVEEAREDVAALVKALPSQVVFTSGATEANITALGGGWDWIALPATEHDSVLAPARTSGARIVNVPVGRAGVVTSDELTAVLAATPGLSGRRVAAVQLANNETGVLQPVAALVAAARTHGFAFHTDAVQAAGRIAIDFNALGADTMALSAHKLGGPKGIGALIIRDGVEIAPLITGGGQERRRRAGTENVAAIAGFGAAARIAAARLAGDARVAALRDRLEAALLALTPAATIFGTGAARLPNTTCIGVAGRASDITVIKLDVAGFAVSAGSACSSGRVAMSHVLAAMGADAQAARGAIRISIGHETTAAEIDAFTGVWAALHESEPGSAWRTETVIETRGQSHMGTSALGE